MSEIFWDDKTEAVVKAYTARYPDFPYTDDDWRRISFAGQITVGDTAADVGTGTGVFAYLLAHSDAFSKVVGVDIRYNTRMLRHDAVDYGIADIRETEFSIGQFDSVICMEVIEHLDESSNDAALANLRSAARKRLIITVPFDEPEPLWWHDKPGGHRQKFDLRKLEKLFPNAIGTIQPCFGVDWVVILEDSDLNRSGWELLDRQSFLELAQP